MNFLMLSCFRATELIEKRRLLKLGVFDLMRLHMHTMMCDACRLYEKQSKIIDTALNTELSSDKSTPIVSDESANNLIERILTKEK